YLETWQHTPVQSDQLCRCMTEATGINCEPFWDQWIKKPGHPILDYTWTYDEGAKQIDLTVKQTQDTSKGIPTYKIPGKVGVIYTDGSATAFTELPLTISQTEETFKLDWDDSRKIDAVILDPDHDYLREIPDVHWSAAELPYILKYAPECDDRGQAMRMMLSGKPTDEAVHQAADALAADTSAFPAFRTVRFLSSLQRADLRPLWLGMLNHPNFDRRAQAVAALADLPAEPETTQKLRALIDDKEPVQVVVNAIGALANWDLKANTDVIKKALTIPSHRDRIEHAAQDALGQ
ncbi:MAG TPA: hypothetical protein VMI31_03425, partial [Fimbriimonadaceae bacterium]|nr:hypothetical protein [Fimbriimonadaceae bacterium]